MKPARVVFLLSLASLVLTAQVARRVDVPLKNWAAPQYWQPNQAETQASGKVQPQLSFSANQVSSSALTFIAITPCRLVDTRGAGGSFNGMSPFSGPSIAAAATVTFPVQLAAEATADTAPAPCGVIPSIAQAYSLNVTVVPHAGGAVDYISLWPAGGTQPFVATLNDPQGAIAGNAAIVPAGTPSGGVSIYNSGPATMDVIIDMNGFFAAPTDLNGNTALGNATLLNNTTGNANTATGFDALLYNTTGSGNTANGYSTLVNNTTGISNTAIGYVALNANTTGGDNTATGSGALAFNTTGSNNTANGIGALLSNTTGAENTGIGGEALNGNTAGVNNTAIGYSALFNNTVGSQNTASGSQALGSNTSGGSNTASGYGALEFNTTGSGSTALGAQALTANTTGTGNTAAGAQALTANTTGGANTAIGTIALINNTTGADNTATGFDAMVENTTGSANTAAGYQALQQNTIGIENTAYGVDALIANTTGGFNIAIGYAAAQNVLGTNSNNIHISNTGASGDSGVVKIGTVGTQTSAFIAGISGASVAGGVDVLVNANGQLGTVLSSRRFKDQITDMGDTSNKLLQLRPVNFFYKPQYDDGSHLLQYGLVAEEVAKVYPEMVAYDNDGQILTVKYQLLAPMLLNEVQKQAEQIRALETRLAALETGH